MELAQRNDERITPRMRSGRALQVATKGSAWVRSSDLDKCQMLSANG